MREPDLLQHARAADGGMHTPTDGKIFYADKCLVKLLLSSSPNCEPASLKIGEKGSWGSEGL